MDEREKNVSKKQKLARNRMKSACKSVAADVRKSRQLPVEMVSDFMDKLKDKRKGVDSRFRKGRSTKYDVSLDDVGGHRNSIGHLHVSPTGALLMQFVKKIKRTQVMTVLKCLSYSHDSTDPHELEKKVCTPPPPQPTSPHHTTTDPRHHLKLQHHSIALSHRHDNPTC